MSNESHETYIEKVSILIDGAAGIYVPQRFVNNFVLEEWRLNEDDDDIQVLQEGPDHELYWDAWEAVMDDALHVDSEGHQWGLWQDDSLYAFRLDMTDEEWQQFTV